LRLLRVFLRQHASSARLAAAAAELDTCPELQEQDTRIGAREDDREGER